MLTLELSKNVGLQGTSTRPIPPGDHCRYELTVAVLQYSRRLGKQASDHTQHKTVRKLKSAFSIWVRSIQAVNQKYDGILDDAGKVIQVVEDISSLLWYQRFNAGMKYRMGNIWKPNKNVSTELIRKTIVRAELKRREADRTEDCFGWLVFGAYIAITYTISLRGSEFFGCIWPVYMS